MAMIECKRFVEFGGGWFSSDRAAKTRTNLVFAPITINTEYVAWLRRADFSGGIELCEVHMADRGGNWTIDETYETMKGLLMKAA